VQPLVGVPTLEEPVDQTGELDIAEEAENDDVRVFRIPDPADDGLVEGAMSGSAASEDATLATGKIENPLTVICLEEILHLLAR
jgi:hypothetical protein